MSGVVVALTIHSSKPCLPPPVHWLEALLPLAMATNADNHNLKQDRLPTSYSFSRTLSIMSLEKERIFCDNTTLMSGDRVSNTLSF